MNPAEQHPAVSYTIAALGGLGWGFLTSESGFGAALVWITGCFIAPVITLIFARKHLAAHVALTGRAMLGFVLTASYLNHHKINALHMWWSDSWIYCLFACIYMLISSIALWIATKIRNQN